MTAIIGWAHSKFGKLDGETLESLIASVAREAIADAGVAPADIEAIYVGNFGGFEKQSFPAAFALNAAPELRFRPATRVENACATGSAAVHMADQSIKARNARF
ncbi:MAG: thiolase domain-containing protein, partial [Parvibaculaceae bacterium]